MRTRVELYSAALRRQAQLQRVMGGLTTGLFLGVLDGRHREQLDELFYDTASEWVDGVQRGFADEEMVRSGLFRWEADAIERCFPPGGAVAIVGAGAGREVLALLERGFDARGFEPHPKLVAGGTAVLEAAGHAGRLHPSGRSGFPLVDGGLEAVVVGWGAYGLIAGSAARVALLRGARSHLEPGAPLLLSFMVRPTDSRYLDLVYRTASVVRHVRRANPPEPGDCLLPNYVHYFSEAELRGELAEAGFFAEFVAPEPYGHAVARAR